MFSSCSARSSLPDEPHPSMANPALALASPVLGCPAAAGVRVPRAWPRSLVASGPAGAAGLPAPLGLAQTRAPSRKLRVAMAAAGGDASAAPQVEERLGIRIERNPSDARLKELGVFSWGTWGCPASEFPWTYSGTETCYLLKGKVKVTPAGTSEFVEFGAGDLVVFPDGMSCTWSVSEAVHKHFKFD